MISDSIINASIPYASKDFAKKKRANRSAKLKQCKLDARREQWLSQVKNKDSKEVVNGGGGFDGRTIEIPKKVVVVEEESNDCDLKLIPADSPLSSVSGGNDSGSNFAGSSSGSSSSSGCCSSFSSGGSFSGSVTEEEEGGCGGDGGGGGDDDDDDGCLDDWETVADALVAEVSVGVDNARVDEKERGFVLEGNVDGGVQVRKSKSESVEVVGKGGVNGKAWRADDAFRPQTLPNLAKQRSFPANTERLSCHGVNPWVRTSVPTSCPICCEDLDLTDTSFLPCSCGFRLCLFCHKRILEDDGRCPGCRKPYACEPVDKETNVCGGSLTVRLTRSCSMFSRV